MDAIDIAFELISIMFFLEAIALIIIDIFKRKISQNFAKAFLCAALANFFALAINTANGKTFSAIGFGLFMIVFIFIYFILKKEYKKNLTAG
ncbi:MAG: hypothetical protein AAB757_01815 [Patescibacteria group bacterium]